MPRRKRVRVRKTRRPRPRRRRRRGGQHYAPHHFRGDRRNPLPRQREPVGRLGRYVVRVTRDQMRREILARQVAFARRGRMKRFVDRLGLTRDEFARIKRNVPMGIL